MKNLKIEHFLLYELSNGRTSWRASGGGAVKRPEKHGRGVSVGVVRSSGGPGGLKTPITILH